MKPEKKANTRNEKINPQAEELADLAVTDEQARLTTGGRSGSGSSTGGDYYTGTVSVSSDG